MENSPQKSGYGKRPLWQWIVLYLVIGAAAYAAIYYFVIAKKGGYSSNQNSSYYQENVQVESAQLKAVGTYTGSGTATRSFDGYTFTHTVKAALGDPQQGKFYEGWLVKNPSTKEFFSTGRLEKQNNEYVLTFTASQNYLEHNKVVITEETEALGLDGNPEAHVLEGSF